MARICDVWMCARPPKYSISLCSIIVVRLLGAFTIPLKTLQIVDLVHKT
jgi:hypothetical protein